MHIWVNFKDKFKRYGVPEAKEVKGLLLTVIVFAFIISFRDWGTETFSPFQGVQHFVLSIFLVAIAFIVFELGHRCFALWMGYRSQYKVWFPGLLIGLLITFLSNGYIPLILPGALIITHLTTHRLGKFFYEYSMKHAGWIGMAGSVSLMLFAIILKGFAGNEIVHRLMMVCILMSIFNMLPIPPMNGLRTFFGSRFVYVFVYASLIACGLLLTYVSGLLALIGSLVMGALILLIFFAHVDKRW